MTLHRLPTSALEELLDRAEYRLRLAHGRMNYDGFFIPDRERARIAQIRDRIYLRLDDALYYRYLGLTQEG